MRPKKDKLLDALLSNPALGHSHRGRAGPGHRDVRDREPGLVSMACSTAFIFYDQHRGYPHHVEAVMASQWTAFVERQQARKQVPRQRHALSSVVEDQADAKDSDSDSSSSSDEDAMHSGMTGVYTFYVGKQMFAGPSSRCSRDSTTSGRWWCCLCSPGFCARCCCVCGSSLRLSRRVPRASTSAAWWACSSRTRCAAMSL